MREGVKYCIGVDEAGRGSFAGPVVAAAVCFDRRNLPEREILDILDDSKKLSSFKRRKAFDLILEESLRRDSRIAYGVGVVDNHAIDDINIRQATELAMKRALEELSRKIHFEDVASLLVDGRDNFRFEGIGLKPLFIINGDAKVPEIQAAGILAKVFRDELMKSYSLLYPCHGFDRNKGYGTRRHRSFLVDSSRVTGIHRVSYRPVHEVLRKKKRLLLHVCCGPDASVPIIDLKKNYEIVCFWYDPNIQPKSEYDKRLRAFKKVCDIEKIEWHEGEYDVDAFLRAIRGYEDTPETGAKCTICYSVRLKRSVLAAKEYECDAWTTSLNISPHKSYEKLTKIGKALEKHYGIPYLAIHFLKNDGFLRSVKYCEKHHIFRQNYCGCAFSDTYPEKRRCRSAKTTQ